jgi:hypothetical protein
MNAKNMPLTVNNHVLPVAVVPELAARFYNPQSNFPGAIITNIRPPPRFPSTAPGVL